MGKASVFIGTPLLGDFKPYFVETVLRLVKPQAHLWRWTHNVPVDIARNRLAAWFLESPMSHLFMMDTDMQFPPDALARLVANDLPVVSGLYFSRTQQVIPHAYRWVKEEEGKQWYHPIGLQFIEWMRQHPDRLDHPDEWSAPDDYVVPVDAVGAGCLLIKREVLETIPQPWFESDGETGGGEDFDFCRKAKKAGFDISVNLSVQCSHELRPVFVGRDDFEAFYRPLDPDGFGWNDTKVTVQVDPAGRYVGVAPVISYEGAAG